ncbi:MAG: hypothetical protein LBR85_09510 [Oscillospiraceae bacterium]|jgi:hypothetical protein|nr:hypothetical protein [Oscillospiraceae bacterium]
MNKRHKKGETWSAERIKELTMKKIQSRAAGAPAEQDAVTPRKGLPRFAVLAASLVVALSVTTAALAATGALGNIFSAFAGGTVNGGLGSGSRKEIVENDFPEAADPLSSSGESLTLNAYYADEREIGLNFTLGGVEVEKGFYSVLIPGLTLEITGEDGSTETWERSMEGEKIPDMGVDAAALVVENGCDISVVIDFHNGNVPVGRTAKVTFGEIIFHYQNPIRSAEVKDDWSFTFDIADKFAEVTPLAYTADADETQGITIKSVSVLPSVCRIEAEIDYTKNALASPNADDHISEIINTQGIPDGIDYESERLRLLAKFNTYDTGVFATDASGKIYGFSAGGYYPEDYAEEPFYGPTRLWVELNSMYFDAPETLTLTFANYDGAPVIEVPLTLGK